MCLCVKCVCTCMVHVSVRLCVDMAHVRVVHVCGWVCMMFCVCVCVWGGCMACVCVIHVHQQVVCRAHQ